MRPSIALGWTRKQFTMYRFLFPVVMCFPYEGKQFTPRFKISDNYFASPKPAFIYVTERAFNVISHLMTCWSEKICIQTSFCFWGVFKGLVCVCVCCFQKYHFMITLKLWGIQEVTSVYSEWIHLRMWFWSILRGVRSGSISKYVPVFLFLGDIYKAC